VEHVAAILLAAGHGRRMGAYKPLLPFGKQTVIETCVNNFERAGITDIIIVVSKRREKEMRARLSRLKVRFAVNEDEASEMSDSIARGVEQIADETKALFIALADQPTIASEVIRKLLDERGRTGARIIAPEYKGRGGHPVLIDFVLRDELLHLDPKRGLRAVLEARKDEVRRVAFDTECVVRDMDTWDDYCALHTETFGTAPPSASPFQR
jgi:molybdenum cofactor cytidylyltransferase